MNSKHEGRLAYAKAAQNHNLVVSPYLYPEAFGYMDTKSSIPIDGLSDRSLQDLYLDIQRPYNIFPISHGIKYLGEYKEIESKHHSYMSRILMGAAVFPAGIYALYNYKNQENSKSPIPPHEQKAIDTVNKCTDLTLKNTEAEVSAQIKEQAANANVNGITISYKKTSNEFSRAVELCIANEVKSQDKEVSNPQLGLTVGSTFMLVAMAAVFAAKASKLSRKADSYNEKAQVIEGDEKILIAEMEKRELQMN